MVQGTQQFHRGPVILWLQLVQFRLACLMGPVALKLLMVLMALVSR